jgi:energy-coupling factor transporter ATP-binding protein EcfA2
MDGMAIKLRGVGKRYRHFSLAGVDLEVARGRALGVVGQNGAGESTLLQIVMGPVLGERERRSLPFVMSLPVAPRDVAVAKLLSSYIMFLVPGTVAATALVFLSPVDVFAAMASDGRSLLPHLVGWALYFALMLWLQGRKTSFV